MMKWLNIPAKAEFEDRSGVVRTIYGCSILGRLEFVERLQIIKDEINNAKGGQTWDKVYLRSVRLRDAIDKALACWGIDPAWLSPAHIEALLLFRQTEGGEYTEGYLVELFNGDNRESGGDNPQGGGDNPQTVEEAIAILATHCQSLTEAIDLAGTLPAEMLGEILKAKSDLVKAATEAATEPSKPAKNPKIEDHIKQNFDKLMRMGA